MKDRLGFFSLLTTPDEKGYLGALLVTDDLGKPEEFRVTYPVKPTLLQRQLYGDSLVPHVGVELCGKPLLRALTYRPDLLIVNDVRFLQIGEEGEHRVVFLERLGETLKVDMVGDTIKNGNQSQAKTEKLHSSSSRFKPLLITFPSSDDEAKRSEARRQLETHFESIDLLEPFSRIEVAIKALAEQDDRFR